MEGGGRPEDVSLLAGGNEQPLIPVQGGGGGHGGGDHTKPWDDYNEKNSVLLQQGASENPEITAMSGGGFFDFLLGAPPPPVTANIPTDPQNQLQAFNTLWTSLDARTKAQIVKDTNDTIATAKANGADDAALSEIIPNTLLKNTLDAVDRQYGTNEPNAEKLLKYGTAEQIEAGRKKYLELKAAGKTDEQTLHEVEDEMARYQPQDGKMRTPQFAMGFLSQASQKIYRTFEDRIAYKNEYQFNISKPLDKTHPMLVWLEKLEFKYKGADRFGRYMNDYIQSQEGAWAAIKTATGKSPNSKTARLAGSTYVSVSISGDKRVTCLDKSIEHVVVIPPLEELKTYNDAAILDTTAILTMILRDLHDLNLFTIDDEAGTCKVNKKVALIFASAYTSETTTYRSVFLYMSTLEMQNRHNVFCMSNFSENEIRAGLSLLNLIPNKEQTNMEIPTLLSPCGVLYPYRMKSNVDGIFVGCNFNEEYSASIFSEVYKSPYYGKQGCGLFVNDKASFVKSNRSVLRYNYVLNRAKTDFLAKVIIPEIEPLEPLETFQRELASAGAVDPAKVRQSLAVPNSEGKLKTVKGLREYKGANNKKYLSVKDDNTKLRIIIWGLFYVVDGLNKLGGEIKRILGAGDFDQVINARANVKAAMDSVFPPIGGDEAAIAADRIAKRNANPKAVHIYLILDLLTVSANTKDHSVYLNRGQFTVLTELFIYIRNNLDAIVTNLKGAIDTINIPAFKSALRKFLDEHIDSVTYTRFPLEDNYKHYINLVENMGKQKTLSDIYGSVEGITLVAPVARGGGKGRKTTSKQKKKGRKWMIGGGHCGEKRVQGRAGPMNMFELEQFAPYTICAFSIKKKESREYGDGTGDVCREEAERSKEMNGNFFTQWSVETEIADASNLQIIDVGDKTYAIRIPSDAVSCNWSGYKSKQMVMYTPNISNEQGGIGPLLNASHIGDVEMVRKLIEETPALANSKDSTSDMTALHVACQAGRVEVMKLLLEKNGAGVNQKATKSGDKTPLHFACENGRSGVVKALLEQVVAAAAGAAAAAAAPAGAAAAAAAPAGVRNAALLRILNEKADNDMTAIHFACKNGHVEVLNELLAKYPDADSKSAALGAETSDGKKPLYYACEGGHTPIVEIVLRSIPDADAADAAILGAAAGSLSVNSPLGIALKNGKSVVVEIFLRKISQGRLNGLFAPNTKNPLHFACEGGNLEVVKQVLNKCGENAPLDINIYSLPQGEAERKTSLHIACEKGYVEIVQELLSRLPDKPAAIDMTIHNEENCLHIACKEGYTRLVHELLNAHNAAINSSAANNKKPLHFACEGGHAEVVSELLSRLADKTPALAEQTTTHNTPLHFASKSGNAETVREILKAYPDGPARLVAMNLYGEGDKTSLHFACESEKKDGKVEVVKLLLNTIAESTGTNKVEIRNNLMAALKKPDGDHTTKPLHTAAAADKGDEIIREILSSVENACKAAPAAPAAAPGAAPAAAPVAAPVRANAAIRELLLARVAEQKTPLHIACEDGNVDAVKGILGFVKNFNERNNGPDESISFPGIINAITADNETPLIIATERNVKSVVRVLIAEGADKTIPKTGGQTALQIAAANPILHEVRDLLAAQQGGGGEGPMGDFTNGFVGGGSGDSGGSGCSGCSGCSGSSGCSGCSGCSGPAAGPGPAPAQELGPNSILAITAAAGIGALGIYALTKKGKVLPNIPVNSNPLAGGNMCDGIQQDIPVLVKGEADLLNDLNLTPTNMKEIFSSENHYANTFKYESLKTWGAALEMFFRNLTVKKCYENRLLLTTSECEEAKCFLYSIRDYLEDPVNETEVNNKFLKGDSTKDTREPSLEDDTEVKIGKISIAEPRYSIFEGKPTVRVGAIEKATNKRVHFNLKLSKDSENKGQRFPTDAEIEELKAEFEKKQLQYKSKYVMYLY